MMNLKTVLPVVAIALSLAAIWNMGIAYHKGHRDGVGACVGYLQQQIER